MDYIRKQIDQRIDFLQSMGEKSALKQHFQARFEYILIYLLGYLWNKNLLKLHYGDKEFIFQSIIKPTIGSVVAICRKLDVDKEIFKRSKLSQALEKYPSIRNELLGHGFVYEDAPEKLISALQELYDCILFSDLSILKENVDLVYIHSFENSVYKGISYKSDGVNYTSWSCPINIAEFKINSLYGSSDVNSYFRLSPFIEVNSYGRELFFFNSIDEKLLGKVKYNQLLETGITYKEWDELCELDVTNDGIKIKSHNGTIRNAYENNYKKYIDIGIKNKIRSFLIKNKSSVSATVWGHGGVGKTATIQSLCEDLANDERKVFDYIVFLSAKDRRYDYYTGKIEDISNKISTFSELIKGANTVLFNRENDDKNPIINIEGKRILLVIDDFETFPKEEKDKIEEFISELNTNHHKVIITTRAANINIGQEYQTNELTEEETKRFLLTVIQNEEIGNEIVIRRNLEAPDSSHKVFEITSGRPLFIFQFAFILAQKGLGDALNFKIKEGDTAIKFLFGRIYDYLSAKAKDLFVVLSLLVTQEDLSNVIEKAQYILNLEHESDIFNSAVNELVKLKIIKLDDERRFFEIYSKEIFQIMSDYFEGRTRAFKGHCIQRLKQVNRDKTLDVEHSLLLTANANRLAKNEIEVIDSYKQIINRASSPLEIKLTAILNLAAYLVDRGKKDVALKYLDDYSYQFNKDASRGSNEKNFYATFTKMWATYYWANGTREQKEKAVESLIAYAASGFDYNEDIDLELSGMFLQYRSILVISDWQDLKEKRNYNEISSADFKHIREKQKQMCKDIHDKQGIILYNKITSRKLDDISSGARQNVIAGLYNFLEVLVRLRKFELVVKICDYVLFCAPQSFHLQFKKKQDWVKTLLDKDVSPYIYNSGKPSDRGTLTELGKKLSDAFDKKKK
ncbi:NB-ARC domain-containing protein [Leptolyngbya sp. PCC 6406]|uniref:NB-ARC domain-containing protein n=1 Tax=Leptolyngbya sp. PCC 6406 TaxID=1173264 RepID=UPI0002AC2E80|nr:NB-ARC domain-containing protein [Leptolyngbya sp. PCC 6406]